MALYRKNIKAISHGFTSIPTKAAGGDTSLPLRDTQNPIRAKDPRKLNKAINSSF